MAVLEKQELREGDIFDWRWADDAIHAKGGSWGSYHCKSQRAVVKYGKLIDTYWFGGSENSVLKPENVTLTFLGNIADLDEISQWERPYYRSEDIIDMRHANNSSGPVYRRKGATKDTETIRAELAERRRQAEIDLRSAARRLADIAVHEHLLNEGRLDEVHL